MSQAKGYEAQLLVGFENEFAETPVPATTNAVKLPFNSGKLNCKQNLIEPSAIRNRREQEKPIRGNTDVSGSLVFPLDEVAVGYWLKAMFGAPQTGTEEPYTHVFKPQNTQPSLVIEQGFPDIGVYELFTGCKINKFSVKLGPNLELTATAELLGSRGFIESASINQAPTEIDLVRFHSFQASVSEGGAALGGVVEANLNIEFGLADDCYSLGNDGCRSEIPEGLIKISGNIKAFFADEVLLNKAVAGVDTSLTLRLDNGLHYLEFFLPETAFEQNYPVIEGSKGVLIDLPFRAYYENNTNATSIVATLVNAQATY